MPSPPLPPLPPSLQSSPPYIAKPVLASTLLQNLLRQQQGHRRYHTISRGLKEYGPNEEHDWDKVKTGFVELDDYVLVGGVERGTVVGISGDVDGSADDVGGGVGRLICLHLLVTVLLSNPLAKASIIDTTGSFPVSLLARIVRLRIASQNREAIRMLKSNKDQMIDVKVQEMLGRVAISRAFDIEGIWEVLSEISADCQPQLAERDLPNVSGAEVEIIPAQMTEAVEGERLEALAMDVAADGNIELEIGDSEAEEEEEDLEDVSVSGRYHIDISQVNDYVLDSISASLPGKDPARRGSPPERRGRTEIVIIDNMTTPINDLFSHREKASAHTLLSTFSRTLYTLSQTHNILTLLLNAITTPTPPLQTQHPSLRHSLRPAIPKNPTSVFASTTSRPALGRLFSDLCALHLLISSVPKTAHDAEVLYASPPDPATAADDEHDDEQQHAWRPPPPPKTRTAVDFAFVIEILKDTVPNLHPFLFPPTEQRPLSTSAGGGSTLQKRKRDAMLRKGNRTQRWAPFVVSADGLTLQNAFAPPVARKSALAQMHIVKQFPFGRRI